MPTTLKNAVKKYLQSWNPAQGTISEYKTTVTKWQHWNGQVPIERLDRSAIRDFLSWVYDRAMSDGGSVAGVPRVGEDAAAEAYRGEA